MFTKMFHQCYTLATVKTNHKVVADASVKLQQWKHSSLKISDSHSVFEEQKHSVWDVLCTVAFVLGCNMNEIKKKQEFKLE